MRGWLVVPIAGVGTSADPFRPDLGGVGGIRGCVAARYGAKRCLVRVVGAPAALAALATRPYVRSLGDDDETPEGAAVGPALGARLAIEAGRLGAGPDWRPQGYDVQVEE